MYREMIFAGKDPPGIDSDVERVLVTLTGGAASTRIPFYVSQLPPEERTDVDTLLVLYTLCHRQAVSAPEVAPLLQKRPESAQVTDILGDLVKREILVKTSDAARGPSVTYGRGPRFPPKSGRRRP